MKRMSILVALMALLQGCSVMTIVNAPKANHDLATLESAGADKEVIVENFGEPVETVSYISPIIVRRDLHEYPTGIKHKLLYSLLSGTAAVYTLGISEFAALPVATEAARATDALRVYYGPDGKVYGSASYSKKVNMWVPNYIEHEGNFRYGFPCYDFSAPSRKVISDLLVRKGRSDLADKVSNCLSLERVQATGS